MLSTLYTLINISSQSTYIYLENFISGEEEGIYSVSSKLILIVTELTGAGQDATHVARLQARSMFKDIRAEAEEYIYKKLVSI